MDKETVVGVDERDNEEGGELGDEEPGNEGGPAPGEGLVEEDKRVTVSVEQSSILEVEGGGRAGAAKRSVCGNAGDGRENGTPEEDGEAKG